MARCKTCGGDAITGRICPRCLDEWTAMRSEVHSALQVKLGKLSPQNHEEYKKQMKRLEKIWKKDKEKYKDELRKI